MLQSGFTAMDCNYPLLLLSPTTVCLELVASMMKRIMEWKQNFLNSEKQWHSIHDKN